MMLSSVFSSWLLPATLHGRAIAASTQDCPQPTATPSCTEEYFRSQGALPCQFNATIERVQPVQNGNFGEAGSGGYPNNATHLPDGLCAVIIQVTDSAANPPSSYRFGLFLPSDDQWNGRFLTVGNGGFVGAINWPEMGQGPHYGAATMSTDTGHSSGNWIIPWAVGNPGAKLDWGWRAMNGSVAIAKAVVETYYGGRKISHSFYAGCSTGGRQGLKQLEIAPDSFDGVLIGAPAWDQKQYMPWVYRLGYMDLYNWQVIFDTSMDTAILTLAAAAAETCDGADGLTDGIISAPDSCTVNLTAITCPSGTPNSTSNTCLQPAQVTVVQNVYADWLVNDNLVMEGFEPGSELFWSSFLSYGSILYPIFGIPFDDHWPLGFLYDNTTWPGGIAPDPAKVATDAAANDPGEATVDPTSANLAGYGGKMILYHGLADGTIPPRATQRLYNTLQEHRAAGTEDSLLYFPVPGMCHCVNASWGTNAPWVFGGAGQATALQEQGTSNPSNTPDWVQSGWGTPGQFQNQPRYDALLALMEWVEGKVAGVSNVTAVAFNADWSVNRTRPLCPYPKKQVPRTGSGLDLNDADNWMCQ